MDNIVVNELKFFYPEGFHVMDALERSKQKPASARECSLMDTSS